MLNGCSKLIANTVRAGRLSLLVVAAFAVGLLLTGRLGPVVGQDSTRRGPAAAAKQLEPPSRAPAALPKVRYVEPGVNRAAMLSDRNVAPNAPNPELWVRGHSAPAATTRFHARQIAASRSPMFGPAPAKDVKQQAKRVALPRPLFGPQPAQRAPRNATPSGATLQRVARQVDVEPRITQPGTSAGRATIPFSGIVGEGSGEDAEIHVNGVNGRVSIIVRDAPLNRVLAMLAQKLDLNIVATSEINASVTVTLQDVALDDALDSILSIAGYTWVEHRGIIHVTSAAALTNLPPETQGRQTRVFQLNFALATDIEPIVQGLISPVGKVFFTTSSPADNRKTQESLVVEDLPPYLDRISQVIAQSDLPPRQVLIEAYVLEVELKDDNRHGLNLNFLSDLTDTALNFELRGMANATAPQAFFATLQAGELQTLVEAIKNTTDSKTLASPRVLVVNGQQARIQVGEQLGFRVTTTTETSTLETVNFLDVGVVLNVTPRISPMGEVLMHVKPEVSSGEVNQNTGLPEEETTEVETSILLGDGQGVVIGGLIQEKVIDNQSKLPFLGDLRAIGRIFQHRSLSKVRSEIIIALIPRVVPFDPLFQMRAENELMRTQAPLLGSELRRLPRYSEDRLPDAIDNPRRIFYPPRFLRRRGVQEAYPPGIEYESPPIIVEEEEVQGIRSDESRETIPPPPERQPGLFPSLFDGPPLSSRSPFGAAKR